MQCFVRGRQKVNGKNGAGVDLGVRQTHLHSLTTFWHSCHFGHWRPDWKTISDTVSVRCSARHSLMLSSTWLDTDLHFYLSRPCQEGKLACNSKLGWLGRGGEGSNVNAKRPKGSTSHGVCLLTGVVSLEITCLGLTVFIHKWILVSEKADGSGGVEGWVRIKKGL